MVIMDWIWDWIWSWFGVEDEEEEEVLLIRLRSAKTAVGMYPTAAQIRAFVMTVNWGVSDTGRFVTIWMSSLLR